jgi:hypothetical protein
MAKNEGIPKRISRVSHDISRLADGKGAPRKIEFKMEIYASSMKGSKEDFGCINI